MNSKKSFMFTCLLLAFFACGVVQAEPTMGPLRVCADNPRYFADKEGRALLLTGSHVWYNLVDMGPEDPPRAFDYDAYLANERTLADPDVIDVEGNGEVRLRIVNRGASTNFHH